MSSIALALPSIPLFSDTDSGQLQYMRIADKSDAPGELLANRTISLARGATLDVLARQGSAMGLDRVAYTPGLKALRKVNGDVITYRFNVPDDAQPGTWYIIRALGSTDARPFAFILRVA